MISGCTVDQDLIFLIEVGWIIGAQLRSQDYVFALNIFKPQGKQQNRTAFENSTQ